MLNIQYVRFFIRLSIDPPPAMTSSILSVQLVHESSDLRVRPVDGSSAGATNVGMSLYACSGAASAIRISSGVDWSMMNVPFRELRARAIFRPTRTPTKRRSGRPRPRPRPRARGRVLLLDGRGGIEGSADDVNVEVDAMVDVGEEVNAGEEVDVKLGVDVAVIVELLLSGLVILK